MNAVLIGVLVYVVLQLIVGVLVSRGIRSESDYLIAGRRIGLGLATFSMFATWFGAETCVGAAGRFYEEGMAGGVRDPFGYAIALFVVGLVFAVPLWKRGLTTLADLFRQRYGPRTERFAALIMAPTSIFWAAAQIHAFGKVLHAASDLNIAVAITIATAVVIVYTCTGGLLADVMTDLIQGIMIILGLGILLVILMLKPDVHLAEAWQNLEPSRFNLFGGEGSPWMKAELWAVTIFGSVVAQEVAARVLATKSPSVARNSTYLGGGMYLIVGMVPAFLGLVGASLIPGLQDADTFLPKLAQQHLSTFFYILFTGALVSAILSTVDSTLLAASSLVSHNFIVSFRPDMPDRAKLRLARAGVIVFGIVAYALALGADSVIELVDQANGVGSSGILVLMVFGLFSTFGGARAGIATLAVGLGTWTYGTYLGGWECTYLISLAASLITYVAMGALEPAWTKS
jgi:solute:Na+ symporter, SSS family